MNQSSRRSRSADSRKSGDTLDPKVVKAIAHPLRHRILTVLSNRVASPSELSTELDEPLGNVAYHVRTLLDLGCIELVRTAPRRGALEHYYRALVRPFFSDGDWSQLPIQTRNAVTDQLLSSIVRDMADAAAAGGFERADVHTSRTPLELDDEAFEELSGMLADVVDRALELHAESAGRVVGGGDVATISTELAIVHFERKTPSDARGGSAKRRGRSRG